MFFSFLTQQTLSKRQRFTGRLIIAVAGGVIHVNQNIGFCTTQDGVRIAYATVGEGPPLVKAPNWLTHLDFEWESPVWSHWWKELAKNHLLIRFDQRGCGLSDWSVEDISFDAWVGDLEAVVDTLGLESFDLLGISQGGSAAIEYTARHPERVRHIVLYGAYARGSAKRGESIDELEARLTLTRQGWGRDNPAYRQMFTTQFMPGAGLEQMQWFNDLQRISTSPENAARIMEATSTIDVVHRLPSVSTPTLVLHSRGDARIPFTEGSQIAALMPNATLVPLDSENHLLLEHEPAWKTALAAVTEFLEDRFDSTAISPHIDKASASGPFPDRLSEREVEVLRLIAAGKHNPQIASELFISVKTVGNHVSNILNKTNTTNRSEAAAYAVRHGLA